MFHRLRLTSAFLVLGSAGLGCGGSSGAPPDTLEAACQRVVACSLDRATSQAQAERQCRDNLSARYDEVSGYGCAMAYADEVSCYAITHDSCTADGAIAGCEDAEQSFHECQGRAGRDECVLIGSIGGTGACQIGCALFVAACAAADTAGQHACTCNMGDKAGTNFSVAACDESLEATARSACQ